MTNSTSTDEHTNRLIHETSPYLLQHAHNPVDWYPWGPEALERARREGRLILLSIGYSSCHWCHVMERESFEDEEIASLMNEHFVNVKVDREERPDLDEIYMAATQSMNQGRGGWPMTVFLTPNLEPVFAGTYFPPEDRQGIPGFRRLLQTIARAWEQDRDNIERRASEFVEDLRTRHESTGPPLAVGEQELQGALDGSREAFDDEYGGFGPAPKFPNASGLSLLLRLHRRFDDAHALTMVRTTLDAMARGGIYDHVGGGFCRYATDRKWLVPHFEKMLYDNALLSRVYLEAHQAVGDPLYRRVATETLDYVRREMTGPNGGFYSATDADSEGVEGKFFVWSPEQIHEILDDEEARRFNAYYDITPEGNWEGVSIPNAPDPIADGAERLGIGPDELRESLQEARGKVYEARERRPKPGLDDKIITAWNGLMIGALAEAFRVLGETRFLEAAERAAGFILETLGREDGALLRTYREGEARLAGYLEDYAYLCQGLVDLYEANGGTRWLRAAERLAERMLQDFTGADGGALYNTSPEHDDLLMRYREGSDGATPSPNAVAAWSLARLSHHLDRDDFRTAAVQAVKAYGRQIAQYPRGFATSLAAVDFLLEPPIELALVGHRGSDDLESLRREVARHFLPNRIQTIYDPDRDQIEGLPLLEGKQLVDGQAALYVCRDFACEAPITDPSAVESALETDRGARSRSIAAHLAGRATPKGTARYAERAASPRGSSAYARLGTTDLTVARLGFGGYRVHDEREEHVQALRKALTEGINLVDTSTNYTDGGSERLVGNIVHDLVIQDEISRDELVIVSKIGYVQGSNLRLVREREERGEGFPEVVKYAEALWHCIHPSFVEDQLDRSLDRLELETLDVCLLHNPEYYLSDAARRGVAIEEARDEFYRRLRHAFAQLEMEVAAGRLGAYGVSSNALVLPASDPEATELRRMLDAAREAGGDDHHFAVIQLPLNLLETGALFERNDGSEGQQTVLEVARSEQIAVLANRPLNAFAGDTLLRLADVSIPEIDVAFDEQLQRVAELEQAFQERIAPHIEPVVEDLAPSDYFRWAEQLQALQPRLTGLAQWSQLEAQISYTVSALTMALNRDLDNDAASRWADWRDRYLPELDRLITELTRQAAERSRDRNGAIVEAIDPLLPEDRRIEPLARKALWTVASTPGVTSVLNGMRRPEYVDDALEVLRWPPVEDPRAVYQAPEPT